MDLSQHRPNVGVVLIRKDGLVWLGRRADTPGPLNWQFPQGGVDPGETLQQAALRELLEETGVSSVELLARTPDWLAYDFPPGHVRAGRDRRWKGQKQIWFAFRFTSADSEIDLNRHGDVEFDAWRWTKLDEALDLVVPFKREVYLRVIEAFRPLIKTQA
ncbi:MAG: RNA pyrophosphohydrolase [Caulobacteraceae bacterium]